MSASPSPLPRDARLFAPGPKRILSLDGGGTLGEAAAAFARLDGYWREAQEAAQSRGNAAWRLAPEVVLREFRRAHQDDAAR